MQPAVITGGMILTLQLATSVISLAFNYVLQITPEKQLTVMDE
jgi:hypothetical protein